MKIQSLFERDIFRPINGVVKADQRDESSVWQELDEFVITRELDQHLRKFVDWYLDAVEKRGTPKYPGKMAVWISGFFGSGKSHLLKVFSYLLANQEHSFGGQSKKAVSFFESKVKDAMLFGDIKRAMVGDTDIILFNIDSKADHRTGRDLILRVFVKVLNEQQGFSGDHPHIAHMERHLLTKGKLTAFKEAYAKHTGLDWTKERDAYQFNRDEIVKAFMDALGQSQSAAQKWIDGAEENFAISVENFCKWTKEYLDSKGPDHRIVFLVDEVGQFIGGDSKLMLNLQTIIEGLGTTCKQRAWVIVTAQEDMDSVLGEMTKSKKEDFSRIQGRFHPPLKLSSANVDEVIQSRLIAKVPDSLGELRGVFKQKGDILKNQLTFKNLKMTFKSFKDEEDFVKNYPFAPYQFQLIQKIFEAIRKAGATGAHLARGERSMLDAFQAAAKVASTKEVGVLVPLYDFYLSIESFLDTTVKKTIDQAETLPSLNPFDIKLLQVLFLIRYVDEMKGNVDNLVTLCLDQIDSDRLALRRSIEESLGRLESESLISRNGDLYSFLTNEERDINRDIKQVELSSGEDSKLLGDILFRSVYNDVKKHRYASNKMDFDFNREIDRFPHESQKEGVLKLTVISPLADDYESFDKGKCVNDSALNQGIVLIKLGNEEILGREIRTYLQTEKYTSRKNDGTLSDSTKRILKDCAEENRLRQERLVAHLTQLARGAEYFVNGQALKIKSEAQAALSEAFEYLIQNTFNKMGLLKRLLPDGLKELQAILRSNDIAKETLLVQSGENNPEALADLRGFLDLLHLKSLPNCLHDLLEKRALRPYGWPEQEVLVLLARLMVLGEIQLILEGAPLPLDKAYDPMISPSKRRKILIKKRVIADPKILQQARALGKDLFAEMGPDGEDGLTSFLQRKLKDWQASLSRYQPLAETGTYPGKEVIVEALNWVHKLLTVGESHKFIDHFNLLQKDLLDLRDQFAELEDFYEHQKPIWEKLRAANQAFQMNKLILEKDETAGIALMRMAQILAAKSPYSLIKEAGSLIATVGAVNETLLQAARKKAVAKMEPLLENLKSDCTKAQVDPDLSSNLLKPLESLLAQVHRQDSLAHITQAVSESERLFDQAIAKFEAWNEKLRADSKKQSDPALATPLVQVKKQRVIKAADITPKDYIETRSDMEQFLGLLRKELEQALDNDERVKIR